MTRGPVISARQAISAFTRHGYEIDHQTGSLIILRHTQSPHRRLTIPNHKEPAQGTLRALIRQAGITVDDFIDLLH